jgi:hypothetical protein
LLRVEDAWGQGRHARSNSRGFRGQDEVSDGVPPGRVRVLCSGDSFTYGEGVADDRTWCHGLGTHEARLQTVNLGQPGYGVDQAFLRFQRDGAELRHDIHLFAFIGSDLRRAEAREMFGYGKPRLEWANGGLQVTNVPVPRLVPTLGRVAAGLRGALRMLDFARRAVVKMHPPQAPPRDDRIFGQMLGELSPMLNGIFDRVTALSSRNGGTAVFVYLPVKSELAEGDDSVWRRWTRETFQQRAEPFIDLTEPLRADSSEHYEYFIRDQAPAEGHYSELGNARIAAILYEALRSLPDTAARLSLPGAAAPPRGVGG